MQYIIAGIHTGIGKTVCSAVICQATGAHYWKVVQAGDLDQSDSIFVKNTVTNPACVIHPERHRLSIAASPHYAAEADGVAIQLGDFQLPVHDHPLVVETAGGVMSPLSNDLLIIDLMEHLRLPIILVSNNYLGSINHTLLTVQALRHRSLAVKGIVFSGEEVSSSRSFILAHTQLPLLFAIPQFPEPDAAAIAAFAATISINL